MLSLVLAAVTSLLAVVPTTPATHGAWTTYLHPSRYSDLLVRGDTVWCATREAGLLRFSLSQRTFGSITRFPNGLASNSLSSLTYDRSGRLWIGTLGAGVSRMSADGSSWKLVNDFDGLPADSVNCLRAEGDTLWIGTSSGLAFWNGVNIAGSLPVFGQPSPFASNNITGVVVRGDTLWVATSAGIYFSQRSAGLVNWTTANAGLFSTNITNLVTNDTLLFCRFGPNVLRYDGAAWQLVSGAGQVFRLQEDGGIVTATTDTGIWRLTNGGWTQLNSEILGSNDDVATPIPAPVDASHYVAASGNGLVLQPAPGVTTGWSVFAPDGPPDNELRTLGLEGDRVYVGTPQSGVGRMIGTQWRIWPPVPCSGAGCDTTFLNPLYCYDLLVDDRGKKWVASWETSLDEFDDHVVPPVFVHHVVNDGLGYNAHTRMWVSTVDREGRRWFGADTPDLGVVLPIGLDVYDSSGTYLGNIRSTAGLAGEKVHGLAVDRYDQVWVGMSGQGIQVFSASSWATPSLPRVSGIDIVPGTSSLDVQGIVAEGRARSESTSGDTIWVLTTHELQRYRRQQVNKLESYLATYNIPEATPLFATHDLDVGPDGSPWVGTEAGIRVFHPNGSSEDFNTSNSPIAGNQIFAIRVDQKSGVVWIATSTGVSRYDPGYRPPPPPKVAQLDVSIYPNPVSLSKVGIELRLKGNVGAYKGTIYDVLGRQVGRFDVPADGRVIWDGRDDSGRMVKPGVYLVRVEAGGRTGTVRVAVLR